MKHYTPLLWIVVSYLCGVACGQASTFKLPALSWMPAIGLLALIGWWAGHESYRFDR